MVMIEQPAQLSHCNTQVTKKLLVVKRREWREKKVKFKKKVKHFILQLATKEFPAALVNRNVRVVKFV